MTDSKIKKKVLIISMRAGFGHLRAGSALAEYAKTNLNDVAVEHVDILDIDPFFKPLSRFYEIAAVKAPFVWGMIYKTMNHRITSRLIRYLGYANLAFKYKIRNYVKEKNPDVILITNIVCMPVFLSACKNIIDNKKIFVLITDFHGHYYYKFSRVDYYFVPHLKVKEDLEKIGISPEKIVVSGIPISPKFYVEHDMEALKDKYKVNNNYPTALLIASFRISSEELVSVVENILNVEPAFNLLFVSNGNEKFYKLIKNIENSRLHPVYWTNEMEEYIKVSDVVISKAGGLTVSECIALKKPMIIINPIKGQEEYNAEFVEQNGYGVIAKNTGEIMGLLKKITSQKKSPQNSHASFEENPCQKIFSYI